MKYVKVEEIASKYTLAELTEFIHILDSIKRVPYVAPSQLNYIESILKRTKTARALHVGNNYKKL
jgi:hypothetical protein